MIISISSDHAGYRYKEKIKKHLEEKGFQVIDRGAPTEESVDYPDFIRPAAKDVAEKRADKAIGVCSSGVGVSIVANKVKSVRAALVFNEEMARLSVQHNNANFLALGQSFIPEDKLLAIVDTWLGAQFEGGRHQRRVDKIEPEETN